MASSNNGEGRSSWTLQSKARASLPQYTPASQSAHIFSTGIGFSEWTNVPPVGVADPYIADQMRSGRRVVTGPSSSPAPEPWGGGKRCTGPHISYGMPAGKRAFPEIVGKLSTDYGRPQGLKRVESRARSDVPVLADPNTAVADAVYKPESVKFFPGTNQVRAAPKMAGPPACRARQWRDPMAALLRRRAPVPCCATSLSAQARRVLRVTGGLQVLACGRARQGGEGRLELEQLAGFPQGVDYGRGRAQARPREPGRLAHVCGLPSY